MYRVVTVAREFASGGGEIARELAGRLGWNLLDRELIEQTAQELRVDPEMAAKFDEAVDPWMHRAARRALWRGAFEGIADLSPAEIPDAESTATLAHRLIERAAEAGHCVIVGRGGQCLLQDKEDVFHVFIYAPWPDRLRRAQARMPGGGSGEELIVRTDRFRSEYVRRHFDEDWRDPHLYNLMLCSHPGKEAVVRVIEQALMEFGHSK
jgi:CMP/dCMP kinase